MRSIRTKLILALSLVLTFSVSTALGNDGEKEKKPRAPKNMGTVTVKTSPVAYPVKIDGQYRGMSGVGEANEFYLTPGFHTIEVEGPGGKIYRQEVEVKKGIKVCICLKTIEETTSKPCPYRFRLEGPSMVTEGDPVRFRAIPELTSPVPLKFRWTASNGTITGGQGTDTIIVDSKGMGGRTINAELDVNDDVYDNRCRQVINVPTEIERIPETPPIEKIRCDEFNAVSADDDKVRFDNCVIMSQNTPDSRLYVIIYPGTDKRSRTVNTYDRLSKRSLDYMVRNRGMDPARITFLKGSPRARTSYEVWIVPAGAEPPVAQ